MPQTTCTVDTSAFNRAVKQILADGKKDAATEINRRVIQVLIGAKGFQGAVHLTRKATEARIFKDLSKEYHVAGTRWTKGKTGKTIVRSGGMVKLIYILASKRISANGGGKGMTFAQYRNYVGQVAEQIYSYRVRSRAYLAAGWLQCAHRLMAQTRGVTFTGKQSPDVVVREGHKAATSYVSAAIPGHLTVTCYNNAADDAGSDAIALEGLEKGIAEQVRDMEEHLQRKLEASAIKAIRKVVFS